ncbi:MAG: hypothetical protein A2V67_08195 [Deltaproteobacteria bacterium RBG_13_61_14]|nr:MAG: hypothetical protein A2V67_08195 [Deltaproteobacteria bacterium RBG_13_61_14]
MKTGEVKVKKNSYVLKGKFHYADPNKPIRDEKGKLCGVTNPRQMTHIHSYGGEAPFFAALGQGKLLASRCDNPECEFTGTIYLPFRIYCPDCLRRNKVLDVTRLARQTAKIHTFVVTSRAGAFNALKTPIKFIDVEFEGVATFLKSVLMKGEPAIDQRVVPIFRKKNPTYTIMDLAFVEEGTPKKKLPTGFSY